MFQVDTMYFYFSLDLVSSSKSLNLANYKIRHTVALKLSKGRALCIFVFLNAMKSKE